MAGVRWRWMRGQGGCEGSGWGVEGADAGWESRRCKGEGGAVHVEQLCCPWP